MKTVCDLNLCTACKACVEICPKQAIILKDQLRFTNAIVDEMKCIGCDLCKNVCQVIHPPLLTYPQKWYQGWCNDTMDRLKSSSGGFAHIFAKQIITEGGYVASCVFDQGEFKYLITKDIYEIEKFRGSKYVKSNPTGIYYTIREILDSNTKVLFIGLPCHVAGLKKFLPKDYDNLLTVDLICHGSPSPVLLERFLNQYNLTLKILDNIQFRQKEKFFLEVKSAKDNMNVSSFAHPGIKDKYSLAYLEGLMYTGNCYQCQFAGLKRVSDITIGDSWGSELDQKEKAEGVSLALCQTTKGIDLIQRSAVELFDVDIGRAAEKNHQLREPFPKPDARDVFFDEIDKGNSFDKAVRKSLPRTCLRLDIKERLLKWHIIKRA